MKNERLKNGTAVRTVAKLDQRDYTYEAHKARKVNVTGVVVGHHDSHGLCYDVKHDDGSQGCYDPDELVLDEVLRITEDGRCGKCGFPVVPEGPFLRCLQCSPR